MASLPRNPLTPAYSRGRIAAVNLQIADLKKAISQLKFERIILQNHLDTYAYPVLSLPNEIVSEIFLQTLDSPSALSGPTSPIFLGHICRQWREIALTMPALWTDIHLSLNTLSDARREKRLRLLERVSLVFLHSRAHRISSRPILCTPLSGSTGAAASSFCPHLFGFRPSALASCLVGLLHR
ncbi:hypothetical protein C8R43DRAFT_354184 [Mycena crocata]|nr:hypothetical protein C8R43DRAFT_354184 [Mycena crocata]